MYKSTEISIPLKVRVRALSSFFQNTMIYYLFFSAFKSLRETNERRERGLSLCTISSDAAFTPDGIHGKRTTWSH